MTDALAWPGDLADPLPNASTVAVWGLGWTGVSAANTLARMGKRVVATDTRAPDVLQRALDGLAASRGVALDPRVEVYHGPPAPFGADAVVMTQAIKPTDPEPLDARARGLEVVGEIELASRALRGTRIRLVVIAGTDGKTTTTKLVGHLVTAQRRAVIGGNSWPPLFAQVAAFADQLAADPLPPDAPDPVVVAEISAFQVNPWHTFKPHVAAVTNVAEDHVEEFFQGDMEAYAAAKRAPTDNLGSGDVAVLNVDDPRVRAWEPAVQARGARVLRTSLTARAIADHPDAAYRVNGQLRVRWGGREHAVCYTDALPLLGDHNVENTLTALGVVWPLGLDLERLRADLATFAPPAHRLEHVATASGGVDVYDDSKATNIHAALAGLSALGARPLVIVAGGVDKGLALDPWVEALRTRARAVVLIGAIRARIAREYGDVLPDLRLADSLDEAVETAMGCAQPGDAVVLSPGCSSFDMFTGYAQRGDLFQRAVRRWIAAQTPSTDPAP